ncbi:isocitrate/isopropylmalate family dehydrogenase, partial [Escherichia coli]|nr:isocitrate/isopropylmalate family dehydrogenase [Escherichia coli]
MQRIKEPSKIDGLLCFNLVGDILFERGAMINGPMGVVLSSSPNEQGVPVPYTPLT